MSYCRWSSNDFRCDVYVYEDCAGGWTTHVAGNRVRRDANDRPIHFDWHQPHVTGDYDAWAAENLSAIGLPHDGETFNDPTPGECADRLEALRALGYNVPQYAIDELREEALDAPRHEEETR